MEHVEPGIEHSENWRAGGLEEAPDPNQNEHFPQNGKPFTVAVERGCRPVRLLLQQLQIQRHHSLPS